MLIDTVKTSNCLFPYTTQWNITIFLQYAEQTNAISFKWACNLGATNFTDLKKFHTLATLTPPTGINHTRASPTMPVNSRNSAGCCVGIPLGNLFNLVTSEFLPLRTCLYAAGPLYTKLEQISGKQKASLCAREIKQDSKTAGTQIVGRNKVCYLASQ